MSKSYCLKVFNHLNTSFIGRPSCTTEEVADLMKSVGLEPAATQTARERTPEKVNGFSRSVSPCHIFIPFLTFSYLPKTFSILPISEKHFSQSTLDPNYFTSPDIRDHTCSNGCSYYERSGNSIFLLYIFITF